MTATKRWRLLVGTGLAVIVLGASTSCDGGGTSSSSGSNTTSTERQAQVVPEGVSMEGTGPSPDGAGLLSQQAVDDTSCNKNGRTNFNVVGGGPFCVNPWPAGSDNGGETAPGVTATEVQVVAYVPSEAMNAAGTGAQPPRNRATGGPATINDSIADQLEVYKYLEDNIGTFQLWGRTPKIEIVEASGADEAAQKADALEVIDKRPFMVVDLTGTATGGAPVFSAAVAAKKIVVVSASTTSTVGAGQSPYRWNYATDADADPFLTGAFLGKTLAGGPARYAGDDALKTETRAFGAVYPSSGFDLDAFKNAAKDNGAPDLADAVEFDPKNAAQITEQAPTMVNHLKSAGVTSVVLFGDNTVVTALTSAATAQDFHPEWIITGFAFQDFDGFSRSNDQDQMRHAFGISGLYPNLKTGDQYDYLTPFDWYWGPKQGNDWAIANGLADFVYRSMHYAGPTLTAENLKMGLFSAPAVGGAATGSAVYQTGYGNTVGMPYEEYSQLGSDRALAWWDPDVSGPSQVVGLPGQGMFMYMNNGNRYGYKDFPDEEPTFFDSATSVGELDITSQFADGVVPAASPCPDCPSSK